MTDPIINRVPAERLDRDKGDIASSYSADTICFSSKIRKPFNYQGRAYVTT